MLLFKIKDYNFTAAAITRIKVARGHKTGADLQMLGHKMQLHRDHTFPAILSTTFAGFYEAGRVEPGLYRFYILQ